MQATHMVDVEPLTSQFEIAVSIAIGPNVGENAESWLRPVYIIGSLDL